MLKKNFVEKTTVSVSMCIFKYFFLVKWMKSVRLKSGVSDGHMRVNKAFFFMIYSLFWVLFFVFYF